MIEYLDRERLELTAIICTHHHGDHVGGNRALLERWQVPVYGPARETIPGRTQAMREGDEIVVAGIGLALSVLDIPGHTAGHIAYVADPVPHHWSFAATRCLPSAVADCSRARRPTWWPPSTSSPRCRANTLVYCGHEYTLSNLRFALAVEPGNAALREREVTARTQRARGEPTLPYDDRRRTRDQPFLAHWRNDIRAAASAHADRELADRIGVFAEIRAWKNAFR